MSKSKPTKVKKSQTKGVHLRLEPYFDSVGRFHFNALECPLRPGKPVNLGTDRDSSKVRDQICYRSEADSKGPVEIWIEKDGKCYIRDTKSSTGTFLNSVRLSPPNQPSKAFRLKHGDVIQIGFENEFGVYVKLKVVMSSLKNEILKSSTTPNKPKKNEAKEGTRVEFSARNDRIDYL